MSSGVRDTRVALWQISHPRWRSRALLSTHSLAIRRSSSARRLTGERLAPVAVCEQSEVAYLDETGWRDMEQEAADELYRIELHDTAAVTMSGVAPAEAHLAVVEVEESSVGDGHPMCVAGQILQHMFRGLRTGGKILC